MSNRSTEKIDEPRTLDPVEGDLDHEGLEEDETEAEDEEGPLPSKAHPPREMDFTLPTLDDEHRLNLHHPNDAGVTEFGFYPGAGDAARDLAGDLGSQFLEGATRGEDFGERVMSSEDQLDSEGPFLIEDDLGEGETEDEMEDEARGKAEPERGNLPLPPATRGRKRRSSR